MIKNIVIQNSIKFVNYSGIDHELLNKIIYDVGKIYKEPITPVWSFCSRLLSWK